MNIHSYKYQLTIQHFSNRLPHKQFSALNSYIAEFTRYWTTSCSQVGRGFEHPGLAEGVPAHGRRLEHDDL